MTVQTSKKQEEREKIVRNNQKNVNRMDVSLGIVEDVVIIDDNTDDDDKNKNKQEKKKRKSQESKKDNNLDTNAAHYSNTSNSTDIVPLDVVISPIRNDIFNNDEPIAIKNNSIVHVRGFDSAPTYTNLRSSTAINLPELVIPLTDVRCNNYAYQLLQTAFNGKVEPSVSFMETFNHSQYARWLPDLLAMYDIPIEKIQPIFTDTLTVSENNSSLSED